MRILILLATVALLAASGAHAQTLQWSRTYGQSADYEFGSGVLQTADGGYLVATSRSDLAAQPIMQGLIIRTDANGDSLWTRHFHTGAMTSLSGIFPRLGGGYWVIGWTLADSADPSSGGLYIASIDDEVNRTWDTLLPQVAVAWEARRTRDGGFVIAGTDTNETGLMMGFDATGSPRWQRSFGGPYDVSFGSVVVTRSGRIIGVARSASTAYFVTLYALDDAGSLLWTASEAARSPYIHAVCETPGGSIVVGGESVDRSRRRPSLWMFDSAGEFIRSVEVADSAELNGRVTGLLATATEDVIVTGERDIGSRDALRGFLSVVNLGPFPTERKYPPFDLRSRADLLRTADGGFVSAGAAGDGLTGGDLRVALLKFSGAPSGVMDDDARRSLVVDLDRGSTALRVRLDAPREHALHVELVGADGRTVRTTRTDARDAWLDVGDLSAGIYWCRATSGVASATGRVVIVR